MKGLFASVLVVSGMTAGAISLSSIAGASPTFTAKVTGGNSKTITYGQKATFSVTGLTGSGDVQFKTANGTGQELCQITNLATAQTCQTTSSLRARTYTTIEAVWYGGGGVKSQNAVTLKVTKATTPPAFTPKVTGGTSKTTTYGTTVTFSVTGLTGQTGQVQFKTANGTGEELCQIATVAAAQTCQTSGLTARTYTGIKAVWYGDGNYTGGKSINSVTLKVTKATTPPLFTAAVTGGTSKTISSGNTATFSVTGLTGQTGQVQFKTATGTGEELCKIATVATAQTCQTTSSLSARTYTTIKAVWYGDGNYTGGKSFNSVSLDVATTTTPTVTIAATTLTFGSETLTTFTVTVTGTGTNEPTGTITLSTGSTTEPVTCPTGSITHPTTDTTSFTCHLTTPDELSAGLHTTITATFTPSGATTHYNAVTSSPAVTFTVYGPPVFTSSSTAHFLLRVDTTFTITTTGYPTATITERGALPSGLSFVTNGNGTATISGTPSPRDKRSYSIKLTATNTKGTATQRLTIDIGTRPVY